MFPVSNMLSSVSSLLLRPSSNELMPPVISSHAISYNAADEKPSNTEADEQIHDDFVAALMWDDANGAHRVTVDCSCGRKSSHGCVDCACRAQLSFTARVHLRPFQLQNGVALVERSDGSVRQIAVKKPDSTVPLSDDSSEPSLGSIAEIFDSCTEEANEEATANTQIVCQQLNNQSMVCSTSSSFNMVSDAAVAEHSSKTPARKRRYETAHRTVPNASANSLAEVQIESAGSSGLAQADSLCMNEDSRQPLRVSFSLLTIRNDLLATCRSLQSQSGSQPQPQPQPQSQSELQLESQTQPQSQPQPVIQRRGRGRPRIIRPQTDSTPASASASASASAPAPVVVKRGRGRPKAANKVNVVKTATTAPAPRARRGMTPKGQQQQQQQPPFSPSHHGSVFDSLANISSTCTYEQLCATSCAAFPPVSNHNHNHNHNNNQMQDAYRAYAQLPSVEPSQSQSMAFACSTPGGSYLNGCESTWFRQGQNNANPNAPWRPMRQYDPAPAGPAHNVWPNNLNANTNTNNTTMRNAPVAQFGSFTSLLFANDDVLATADANANVQSDTYTYTRNANANANANASAYAQNARNANTNTNTNASHTINMPSSFCADTISVASHNESPNAFGVQTVGSSGAYVPFAPHSTCLNPRSDVNVNVNVSDVNANMNVASNMNANLHQHQNVNVATVAMATTVDSVADDFDTHDLSFAPCSSSALNITVPSAVEANASLASWRSLSELSDLTDSPDASSTTSSSVSDVASIHVRCCTRESTDSACVAQSQSYTPSHSHTDADAHGYSRCEVATNTDGTKQASVCDAQVQTDCEKTRDSHDGNQHELLRLVHSALVRRDEPLTATNAGYAFVRYYAAACQSLAIGSVDCGEMLCRTESSAFLQFVRALSGLHAAAQLVEPDELRSNIGIVRSLEIWAEWTRAPNASCYANPAAAARLATVLALCGTTLSLCAARVTPPGDRTLRLSEQLRLLMTMTMTPMHLESDAGIQMHDAAAAATQ